MIFDLIVQGKIYMTHPTKSIYGELLKDFVRVSRGSADEALYKEDDLRGSLERIQVLDFHQTIDVDGIQVCHSHISLTLRPALSLQPSRPFLSPIPLLQVSRNDLTNLRGQPQ